MSKSKIIIGISGVAQSGKDTFFQLSSRYLYEELGLSSKRYALADFLKDECRDFLKDKFDLDVYSQDINVKKIFRPFLVWFGDVKREQTQGTYFTKILEKEILNGDEDVAFITDIRYGEYPEDEAWWLRKKLGGTLIHVQRTDIDGKLVEPPNDNERRNDPIMIDSSDYEINWTTHFDKNDPHFEDKMYKRWKSMLRQLYYKRMMIGAEDEAIKSAREVANAMMGE